MKNITNQLLSRSLVFVLSLVTLGLSTSYAQIGSLGIYGSAPEAVWSNVRYARLDPDVPPWAESDGSEYIMPLNGHKNFNFYYVPGGNGFLGGGNYKISYWNASLTTRYGEYEYVTYSPNSDYTNGIQVRAFNDPPSSGHFLGIHANVYGYAPGGQTVVPLNNMSVTSTLGSYTDHARTNGNGYFSLYYADGFHPGTFLPSGDHWHIIIYGSQNGCTYFHYEDGTNNVWAPDTDPNSSGYYVSNAEMDMTSYIPILTCGSGD